LATGDGDGLVKVWDLNIRRENRSLQGHHGFVSAVAFSPKGNVLATADEYGTIILWDYRAGTASSVLPAHRAPIYELAFSRDAKWLVTASRDHTAKLLDAQTGDELATFRGHTDRVWSVEFSPDGQSLATAGGDGVRVWRAAPKADSFIFSPEKVRGTVSFSPDGRFLVQELWDANQVVLWDPASKSKVQAPLKGRDCAFSRDGGLLVLICNGQPLVHNTSTFQSPATIAVMFAVAGPIAISPNGKLLAVRRGNREVIVDLETKREVTTVEGTLEEVVASEEAAPLVFSRDSKQLIIPGPSESSLCVWEAGSWEPRALMRGHTAWIAALAVSPDGKIVASGGYDRTVRLWDTVAWSPVSDSVLASNAGAVTRLAFSPDGTTLAIGTYDGVIKLWNVRANEEVGALRGHSSIIRGLAFSPDGRMLASSSYDGIWRLWAAPSLAETDAISQIDAPSGILPKTV
jgi:WD40 repeat protein